VSDSIEDLVLRALVFLVILGLLWLIAGFLLDSALMGFILGLIGASFAVGAAKLSQKSDGSWSLSKLK
jgi:nitrate/nitrite transporter NarK